LRSLVSGCCLCFFLFCPISAIPQSAGHAKPAGIAAGDTLANQSLEPPMRSGPRQISIDVVNSETQELRRLADGLPTQIDQVTKGQLPKDLADNLKKIEKLAKHLRGEIVP
jgi:hypothetical protein